jgi:hypothetical protein
MIYAKHKRFVLYGGYLGNSKLTFRYDPHDDNSSVEKKIGQRWVPVFPRKYRFCEDLADEARIHEARARRIPEDLFRCEWRMISDRLDAPVRGSGAVHYKPTRCGYFCGTDKHVTSNERTTDVRKVTCDGCKKAIREAVK